MDDNILDKYNEYKQAMENGTSNKERYKLLANFAATNPADVDSFLDLLKGKKSLYRVAGKNKVVVIDEPKFAEANSEKAVDAVYQVKISWATDYKHNKKRPFRI